MQIDYTAKRSIKTGHTATTSYQINIDVAVYDRSSSIDGSQVKSLSGNTVTTVNNDLIKLNINTVLVSSTTTPDIDDMREFLDSVKAGETFQLDSVNYILDSISSPYSETREGVNYFRYSFQVRQL